MKKVWVIDVEEGRVQSKISLLNFLLNYFLIFIESALKDNSGYFLPESYFRSFCL